MKINRVRIGTGLLAAGALAVGVIGSGGTPVAQAEDLCHGKPVTQMIDEDDDFTTHYGTAGDDVVVLKGSAWFTYDAKGGDDTICVGGHGSQVIGGAGDDWVSASAVTASAKIVGGVGDDSLAGSEKNDIIFGGPGSDQITGLAGNDEIYPDQLDFDHERVTEDPADTVDAGAGSDIVSVSILSKAASAGTDTIRAGSGGDALKIDGVAVDVDLAKGTGRASAGGPSDHFFDVESFWAQSPADITGSRHSDFISVGGHDSRVDAKGGADEIVVTGGDSEVSAGSGDDRVDYRADKQGGVIRLGHGRDTMLVQAGRGVEVDGGPGDDRFRLLTHGEVEEDPIATGPITAQFLGESGTDTMSWDCSSTVDVAAGTLHCTHRKATVSFGGLQVYRATEWPRWKDTFRGGPHRDVFYGGADDDTMYGSKGNDKLTGGKGNDTADGGPGSDVCRAEVKKRC
ncbi:calcium-binding protein [Microlunatus soli]|uniref:Ca2+-binding protein, RTX toxin-related n=1 Tax=Microlunatus soli TaxID=630515 RepID=A0A1H1SF77_9ACTN|nr:calcium-binding protein [Microlunatus soli]SDS46581.1 Ca2+-binding protein, RTX toxin-related [Microlunatus soli]